MKDAYSEALKIALTKKRTQRQVEQKLAEKGYDRGEAQQAAAYYRSMGYIDHEDYARRYVNDAVKLKGYGRGRIEMELRRAGVEDEIIENALSDITFSLEEVMTKRFPVCEDEKMMRRIISHFLRKGFSYQETISAVRNIYKIDEQ